MTEQIRAAVAEATHRAYLRPNAVHSLTGKNSGDNLGDKHFPTIHFEEIEGDTLKVELMLKGGGCENVGAQYSLPNSALGAGRDLEGVRKVVLDAVHKAQGKGCAPGILGVAIGGDRGSSFLASKETLFRKLNDLNPDPELAQLEDRITEQANQPRHWANGFWWRKHRSRHEDHQRLPPPRLFLRFRVIHVLGLPPPQHDHPERPNQLSIGG
jgi:fumarate hydratase, class I